jgi:hypothetical protein
MTPEPIPPTAVVPLPLRRRTLWRTILWSAVIFVSGTASGWGLGLLWPVGRPPPLGPEPPIEQIVRTMSDELLLSPQQAQQVQEIYRKRAEALRQVRQTVAPQFAAEYDKLQVELKKVLTAEQFARWQVRFNEARQRMWPPGPPPGRGAGNDRGFGPGGPESQRPRHGMGSEHNGPPDQERPPRDGPPGDGPPDDRGPPDGPPR